MEAKASGRSKLEVDIGQINGPAQADLSRGAKGSGTVRAQVLLGRAHFSCGELDGEFGTNLERTVRAFQGDRKLPVTGTIDAATWTALNGDTAPAIVTYTVSAEDVAGPYRPVPNDMMAKAKLPALGYTSPLEQIAERFHSSEALIRSLNPQAQFGKEGEQLSVPNVLVLPAGQAARVIVSRSESSVRAVDPSGKVLAFYVATTGSTHDPLPLGGWKIQSILRNPIFHYNARLFWDAKNVNDRATIKPGPNSPVGVVWIDLSKPHYGIHGTPSPGEIGHAYSHGCIRLTNWDAADLASMVVPETLAILQE